MFTATILPVLQTLGLLAKTLDSLAKADMMRLPLLTGLVVLTFTIPLAVMLKTPVLAQTSRTSSGPARVNVERINSQAQSTGRRVALVIGNANYREAGQLANPVNDAQDMARTFRELGFEVILVTNGSLRQMETALDQFSSAVRQGSVGVFYYAGHGVQSQGENYLIPIDAQISAEQDLRYKTMPVGLVIGRMEDADNDMNIVILDACRNNPFARSWRSGGQRGLAPINTAEGILIAYATAPGAVAEDGSGRNGTFTAALLRSIRTPNQNVDQLFNQVRADVHAATHGTQIPWTASSLIGNFAFRTDGSAVQPTSNIPINLLSPERTPDDVLPLAVPCAGSVCEGLPQ